MTGRYADEHQALRREWLEDFEQWAHLRHHPASAASAAATATIETTPREEPVSAFTDGLHNLAQRLERYDEEALAKFEAVQATGVTKELFGVVAGLTHVDPTPEFNAVVTLLKAFVPQQQPVQAEPSFTPAGPQVAGQA